jgi:hypothetical protein
LVDILVNNATGWVTGDVREHVERTPDCGSAEKSETTFA